MSGEKFQQYCMVICDKYTHLRFICIQNFVFIISFYMKSSCDTNLRLIAVCELPKTLKFMLTHWVQNVALKNVYLCQKKTVVHTEWVLNIAKVKIDIQTITIIYLLSLGFAKLMFSFLHIHTKWYIFNLVSNIRLLKIKWTIEALIKGKINKHINSSAQFVRQKM